MTLFVSWLPLLFLAIFARFYSGSWLSPIASWAGYWALITSIAIVAPIDYKYSPKAILLIGLFVLAFVVGGMPFKYKPRQGKAWKKNCPKPFKNRLVSVKVIIVFTSLFAIVVCLFHLKSVGYSLGLFDSHGDSILGVSHEISYMRYYGENTYSFWINLFSIPIYSSAFLSGFLLSFPQKSTTKVIWSLAPIAASSLITVVTTAKMTFLMSIFFFLSAYVTAMIIFRDDQRIKIKGKEIALFSSIFAALVVIFFFSLFLRYEAQLSNFHIIVRRFIDSFSGFLTSFSAWIEQSLDGFREPSNYWGFTFQWMNHFVESGDRLQGMFDPIPDYNGYGSASNIFTIYRCMMEDFSLPGALVLLCISSYLFTRAYSNLIAGSVRTLDWGLMLFYYPTVLYSFVFLVFGYSTSVVSWLLACLIIKLAFFNRKVLSLSPNFSKAVS